MPARKLLAGPSTRETILAASLACFARQGYEATNIPSLAQRAGLSTGALYKHFESKEALVNVLYRECKRKLQAAIFGGPDSTLPLDAPMRQQFSATLARIVDFAGKNPEAFLFLERHYHAPYLDRASRAVEQEVEDQAVALLEAGRKLQLLKPISPRLMFGVMWGALSRVLADAAETGVPVSKVERRDLEVMLWSSLSRDSKP